MNAEIEHLVDCFLLDQESMTEAQILILAQWVKSDPAHARHFLMATLLHRKIHDHLVATDAMRQTIITDDLFKYNGPTMDQDLFELMRMEELAPGLPAPVPVETPAEKPAPPSVTTTPARLPRFWLLLAATSMGLLVVIFLGALLLPARPRAVATLVDASHTQWGSMPAPLQTGGPFLNDQIPKQLYAGLAELEFDNGAVVVLEGPALFSIIDVNHIKVFNGRLSTRVPPSAKGFRIDTPGWEIIDLGTEFGVHVNPNGPTDVHLFNGKAVLRTDFMQDNVEGPPPGYALTQGQARAMDTEGHIAEVTLDRDRFVRQFSSVNGIVWRGQGIDLADIVGGGNGLGTGWLCNGIDNKTGLTITTASTENRPHTKAYTAVPVNPYIDGIFTPPGPAGPLQVSSLGHRFADCPATSGITKIGVFNGHRQAETPRHLLGIDYQGGQRPTIDIHASQGLTFDLRAIRVQIKSLHRSMNLSRFTAHAGIATEVVEVVRAAGSVSLPTADIAILVDGKPRCQALAMRPDQPAASLNVPLDPEDRFLTLLVTDGGGNNSWDWVLVVDPTLEVSY